MWTLIRYEMRKTMQIKIISVSLIAIFEFLLLFGSTSGNIAVMGLAGVFLFFFSFVAFLLFGLSSMASLSKDLSTNQGYMLFMLPKPSYTFLLAKILESLLSTFCLSLLLYFLFLFDIFFFSVDVASFMDVFKMVWGLTMESRLGDFIHFMISFVHPFADGNGRTARAMFFWYMLRQGYRLTEYLSISRVIAKSKKAYEKAFLYTEVDGMDIGYFVAYNLKVLEQSFQQLQDYITRKQEEKKAASLFLRLGNFNERQAQIIKLFADDPNAFVTIKDLEIRFGVSPTTAKTDIIGLLEKELVAEIPLNKVKRAYVKGSKLVELVDKLTSEQVDK